VFDLGYLGIEKDFPQQLYHPLLIKIKEILDCHKKIDIVTKIILKEE
jgi:hypothetical protein